MSEGEVLDLQRCLADLALAPGPGADPETFALRHDLPERDQAAFRRDRDGLLFYRETVRRGLWEPVERHLPLTRSLLVEAGAWGACRDAFLEARRPGTPYYRDRPAAFLGWLLDSAWGGETWPCLPQLAHFEVMKCAVEHHPDTPPAPGLHARPDPGDRLVLAPAARLLAYTYRVPEATPLAPAPPPGSCRLLAARTPDGHVRWWELTEGASALLVLAQRIPLARALTALGVDPGEALAFLDGLRIRGALEGYRKVLA